jgi:integrase
LRIGELLALRWRALDLELGTLAVRESVFEGKFQAPKTQKAVRTIPLGPRAIAAIKAHRDRVARKAPTDLVFGNRRGDRCGNPSCCGTCCNRRRRRRA